MGHTLNLSDRAYAAILAAAEARNETPDEVIEAAAQLLIEQDQQLAFPQHLSEEEFAAALGMTPEDVARIDDEVRQRHPHL